MKAEPVLCSEKGDPDQPTNPAFPFGPACHVLSTTAEKWSQTASEQHKPTLPGNALLFFERDEEDSLQGLVEIKSKILIFVKKNLNENKTTQPFVFYPRAPFCSGGDLTCQACQCVALLRFAVGHMLF